MKHVNIIIFLISFFVSCQSPKEKAKREEKFDWNIGISAPKYYASAPYVEFFYKGKSITGASTGAGNGWGITSGGFVTGDIYKPVPDSVFVRWECGTDHLIYEAGSRLPKEKMLILFQNGISSVNQQKEEYSLVIAGTAPGGNVTIWMRAGGKTLTEIIKFKYKNKKVDYLKEEQQKQIMKGIYNSKKYINSETNVFHYLHGVPYSVWEKGEKEYPYDVAFTSKESEYGYHMTLNSKDGSWFSVDKFDSFIPWEAKEINTNKIIHEKHKSPVQLYIQWYTNEENYKERQWYDGTIILPQNFEDFLKTAYFNRLLVAIEKDNHKDFVEGKIMLLGKSREKTIMKFRLGRYDYKLGKQLSPEYILPKDFVFPKWEGREPLTKPTDFEYWQEK